MELLFFFFFFPPTVTNLCLHLLYKAVFLTPLCIIPLQKKSSSALSRDGLINLSIISRLILAPPSPPSELSTTLSPAFVITNVVSVAVAQAEGKQPAGGGAGQEPEPGPSEEGGGGLGPQGEAGRLQEADPAGPEGGEAHPIGAGCAH